MTRDELIEANMKLVPHVMRKYFRVYIERGYEDDIMGCGYLGLVKAADTWDASKGVKFSTYACRVIWQQIYNDFERVYHDYVHIPQHVRARISATQGRDAMLDFVAAHRPVSLDMLLGSDSDSDDMEYFLPSNDEPVEDQAICNIMIEDALHRMSKRQQEIMRQRLANMDGTFEELAQQIGVTRERVRQVNLVFRAAYKRDISFYNGKARKHREQRERRKEREQCQSV